VADAAPTVGAAMYSHGWDRNKDFDQIASSLIAGHLIECSSYVCGGYYSGFKDLMDGCENVGFPIVEIFADGSSILTKEANTGGEVTIGIPLLFKSLYSDLARFPLELSLLNYCTKFKVLNILAQMLLQFLKASKWSNGIRTKFSSQVSKATRHQRQQK
jgi:hypothetical protein